MWKRSKVTDLLASLAFAFWCLLVVTAYIAQFVDLAERLLKVSAALPT